MRFTLWPPTDGFVSGLMICQVGFPRPYGSLCFPFSMIRMRPKIKISSCLRLIVSPCSTRLARMGSGTEVQAAIISNANITTHLVDCTQVPYKPANHIPKITHEAKN